MAKKKETLSLEEKLQQALVPDWEQPYKVPENWCYFYFTSLIDIHGGTQPPKSQFIDEPREGYIRLIQIRDFATDKYTVYIPKTNKLRLIEKKDILIARYGASIGRICSGREGAYNVALAKTVFNDEALNRRYIYWVLNSEIFQEPILKISRTAQAGFNKDDLSAITVPLPPFAEQHRIVARIESLFAKLDEAKELAQSALDSFENRKAAILHQAFTGELTPEVRLDDIDKIIRCLETTKSELISAKLIQKQKKYTNDFISKVKNCKNWRIEKLGKLAFVTKLAGFEYTEYIKLSESGEVPVIRAQNVRNGYLDTTNLMFIDKSTSTLLRRSELVKKSILVTFIGAGIGDVCIFNENRRFHLAPNVAKVEIFNSEVESEVLLPEFVLYFLLSPQGQYEIFKNMKSTAQPSLSMETIRDIDIPIAPISEQTEIVRILDSLFAKETQAKELTNVITQIDLMKKAILARAFRGELGTNVPEEESAVELLRGILEASEETTNAKATPRRKAKTLPLIVRKKLETPMQSNIYRYIMEHPKCMFAEIAKNNGDILEIMGAVRALEECNLIEKTAKEEYQIRGEYYADSEFEN